MRRVELGKLNWLEIAEYLATSTKPTVFIPISPVEEHGPHLPVGLDYILTERIATEVALRSHGLVFPTIPLMCCGISADTTGTYPITSDTLRLIARDLTRDFVLKGFKRVIFLSAHGGYSVDRIREGIEDAGDGDFVAEILNFAAIIEFPPGFVLGRNDKHAGDVETSAAMAVCPEFVSEVLPPADYHKMTNGIPVQLSASGICGDPQKATLARGSVIVWSAVESVIAWLEAH